MGVVLARVRSVLRGHRAVAALIIGILALCLVDHRLGHNWGDDFALYLNQARALVEGNVGQVIADNRFALQGSSWSTFSPLSYPWGFPILLAPIVAVGGVETELLKLVPTLSFIGFLIVFYALVERRAGRVPAFVLVALIGFSPSYFGWTQNILSELPFLFFATLTLWWVDRCQDRGARHQGPVVPLVLLGFLVAFTFNIRREGIALFVGLVLADILHTRQQRRQGSAPSWRRLRLPYTSALGFVVAFQLVLPTVFLQRYPETGLHNVAKNVVWFRDTLAEHIGLKRLATPGLDYLGSPTAAAAMLMVFVVLVVLGLIVRMVNHPREDAAIVGYVAAASLIIAMQPFHEGRHLMAVTPFLVYFALQAIASTGSDLLPPSASKSASRVPAIAASVLIGLFVAGHVDPTIDRVAHRLEYDYAHGGPDHPDTQEMFRVVRERTRGDDVLAFFRARAMNLYGERRTLLLTRTDQISERADWYVMQKDSTYSQALVTPEEGAALGWVIVWENDRWVLWEIP